MNAWRWLVACLVCCFSMGTAQAGYFATVTAKGYYTVLNVGQSTACYLTPSMAISAAVSNGATTVTALDATAQTWAAYYSTQSGNQAAGTFGACTASPSVASIPNFTGGVSDPAISGTSVLSGSSGSSSSGSASQAVDWSQFDYAQAGAIWGFFFTVSMLCWWGGEQIGLMISALKAG